MSPLDILQTFRQFQSIANTDLESLGNNGGFSGARLWKFDLANESYLLRRYPLQANNRRDHILWVHTAIKNAHQAGCEFLAPAIPNNAGQTLIGGKDYLWQVEYWLPGSANFWAEPNDEKIISTAQIIGQFHQVARTTSDVRIPFQFEELPAINNRLSRLSELTSLGPTSIIQSCQKFPKEIKKQLLNDAIDICARFHRHRQSVADDLRIIQNELKESRYRQGFATASICFRDIWHDHLLFDGHQLCGIVDYDALRPDWVATDLARLASSLFECSFDSNPRFWTRLIDAYRQQSVLTDFDVKMIKSIDRANSVLSPMNWVAWIYRDNRNFDNIVNVTRRIRRIIVRMPA